MEQLGNIRLNYGYKRLDRGSRIFLTIISIDDTAQWRAVRIRNSLIKHRGAYELPN